MAYTSGKQTVSDNTPYEKSGNNEPVSIADEVPFEIPDSWEWIRLKDLVEKEIKRGKSPKYADRGSVFVFAQKCNVKQGGIDMSLAKYLDMKTFDKYPSEEYMRDGDIIINSTGNGTLGRIGMFHDSDRINDNIIVPDSHVTLIRVTGLMQRDYLFHVLKYYQPFLEDQGEGSTNQTELRPATVAELFIPIPPFAEQIRITAKLVELLPMVEVYGIKAKSLDAYNKDFPVQLKKSILQMAVQGKLVPQDPADEPASVLLERIRAEKQRLIAEGKIKRDKHESVIFRRDNSHYEKHGTGEICIDEVLPFEIPTTWQWEKVINLFNFIDYRGATPTKIDSGVPLVTAKNVKKGYIDYRIRDFISEEEFATRQSRGISQIGDILFTTEAPMGNVALADLVRFSAGQRLITLQQYTTRSEFSNELIMYFMLSDCFQGQLLAESTGTTVKGIKADKLKQLWLPIPPREEQIRILEHLKIAFAAMSAL